MLPSVGGTLLSRTFLRRSLVACLLVFSSRFAPALDTDYYFYLADGSSVPLRLLTDKMVVETSAEMTTETLDRRLRIPDSGLRIAGVRPAALNRRLFALELATSPSARVWTEQAAALCANDAIRHVYPMFGHQTSDHVAILTREIMVCLRDDRPVETLLDAARAFGAGQVANRSYDLRLLERDRHDGRIVRLRVETPQSEIGNPQPAIRNRQPFAALELANALFRSGAVVWAEPNFLIVLRRAYSPNDPYFPQQWHLHNTGQTGGLADADIDAAETWDITQGSWGVTVAILDDGLELDHPDLRGNIFVNVREIPGNGIDDDGNGYVDDVTGWDFYANDNNPRPDGPEDYHSTPCSGLAAAIADNGIGVSGVAPRCAILPCRVIGIANTPISQVAEAIHYAAAMADILSLSWTTLPNSTVAASLQNAATDGRHGRGCLIAASTGNDYRNDGIGFPASLSFVMAIGASTFRDVRSPYSNYAPSLGVFLLAPSSEPQQANGVWTLQRGSGYGPFSGTSAGPPQVSAVCTLILSVAPDLSRTQVEGLLRQTADKIDPVAAVYDTNGYSPSHGYGRLNAYRAVVEITPDLSPVAFDFQPEVVARGGMLSLSGSIRNLGRGANRPCWFEFWLSNSPSFASLDSLACESGRVPALSPGAEFRIEPIARNLLSSVPDGFYRLGVVVDRLNEQIEVSETNNRLHPTNRFLQVGVGSTQADLTIEGFDFSPTEVVAGGRIAFQGRIINRGAQMSRGVWVEFWLSRNATGGSLDQFLCNSAATGWLGPGESFDLSTLECTIYSPAQGMRNGRYRLGVVVDRIGQQTETNKSNNILFRLDKWLTVGAATQARTWHLYH